MSHEGRPLNGTFVMVYRKIVPFKGRPQGDMGI